MQKMLSYIITTMLLVYQLAEGGQFTRLSAYKSRLPLQTPANFGKTHFIVGLPRQYATKQTEPKVIDKNQTYEAYFSPDDDLQRKLINYINQEKKAIRAAIFSFTDKEIARALCDARKRGVTVEVVLDPSCLSDRFSKIVCLTEENIPLYIYDAPKSPMANATLSNIMHNKFMLFDRNKDDQSLLWTGSYNFTKSARKSNQENAVVLSNAAIVNKFKAQFNALKKRSFSYDQHKNRMKDIH